ncbi:MAG: hypothetical protein HYY33_02180 [Chloroflexi bacterium]|nr:hypothetical protein [Chloroflexota bacterium]
MSRSVALGAILPPLTGTIFSPYAGITRVDMAYYMARAYAVATGSEAAISSGPPEGWEDISLLTQQQQDDVNRICGLGVTNGATSTTFSPYLDVSKEHMSLFLARLMRSTGN